MNFSENPAPVLVLGGTGNYGRPIVRNLFGWGQRVRVLSRNAVKAQRDSGDGISFVDGDITSAEDVGKALRGVKAVVFAVSAFNPTQVGKLWQVERDAVINVLNAMPDAGVSRVVYLSYYHLDKDSLETEKLYFSVPGIKWEVESYLADSDLNWTTLACAPSMDLFFALMQGNRLMVPGGGPPALPSVSPADVGEIAAQTVLRDGLARQRIHVVGPEAISFPQAAARIAKEVNRPVKFRKTSFTTLKVMAAVTSIVNSFPLHLQAMFKYFDSLPADVIAAVPQDHQSLLDTFDYEPTTIEMEARRWLP